MREHGPSPRSEELKTSLIEQRGAHLQPYGRLLLTQLAEQNFRMSLESDFFPKKHPKHVVLGTTSTPATKARYDAFCQRITGTLWKDAYAEMMPQARIRTATDETTLSHMWTIDFVSKLLDDPNTRVVFYVTPEMFGEHIPEQERIAQKELAFLLSTALNKTDSKMQQSLREKVDIVLGF